MFVSRQKYKAMEEERDYWKRSYLEYQELYVGELREYLDLLTQYNSLMKDYSSCLKALKFATRERNNNESYLRSAESALRWREQQTDRAIRILQGEDDDDKPRTDI